jgi:hypothetical protein
MTTPHGNLLGEPPETLLPDEPEARAALEGVAAGGADLAEVAARFPTFSAVWAELADRAFAAGSTMESYAYARTGYHRGLDALRRNGWKGYGPVPWSHKPNQGWLRCVYALGRAAMTINETDEAARCTQLLRDSDPVAADAMAS